MLSKEQLKVVLRCSKFSGNFKGCEEIVSTALQLLEQLETAKTILNDILSSGNVKSCEKEIREFLEGVE